MKKLDFLKSYQNLLLEVEEVKKLQLKTVELLEVQAHSTTEEQDPNEEWISVKQACKILNCSEVTLWKLRKENILPYSRLKRTIRFKKIDVFNYLNQK